MIIHDIIHACNCKIKQKNPKTPEPLRNKSVYAFEVKRSITTNPEQG